MSKAFAQVARETVKISTAGRYVTPAGTVVDIADAVRHAVFGTMLLREATLRSMIAAPPKPTPTTTTTIRCLPLRSGAAAQLLLDRGAKRVGVLNYANGIRPGGGFLHGAEAQEEALCRCSGLFACLSSPREDVRFFYDDNDAAKSALVRDHMLVSPDVPFFRDESLQLLDTPFAVTVITAAAPDLGWLLATTTEGLEPKSRFDDIPALFARRTRQVFAAARHAGCDAVVVGPWGCGAFGNDPEVVAEAFVGAVKDFGHAFEHILFSTWGSAANRKAFERRFTP